ncbi:alpha/beta fold hydrolase [Pseudofrankia inefficax]|uniref:AB hydrolase-1 domain-containing protein n=1 Tax=Pseudofrankia inefficax (strain DSM 45817 / CECT 9037 / DDB 130130 / EuI1c) TaxID=298654 RepID=E3JDB3_PSEI1|nr:alpha/beta fold hydrolase [Pseudofrankia inefficax]ADP83546.1 hypothetical protein FraEuI1c_5560 [Pseudofrankia inefficax]
MSLERKSFRVPAGDRAPRGAEQVAVTLVRDPSHSPDRPVIACCFAGGAMSSGYFDLDGLGPAAAHRAPYSMAAHLAAAGITVLLVDHLATGGSDTPADPWTLVPEVVADVDAAAVRRVLEQLAPRDPVVLGVGHSMGGMLVAIQQARHRLYDGLVLLGHAGAGMPQVLGRDELAAAGDPARVRASIADLAKARFGRALVPSGSGALELLVGPDLPAEAAASLRGCAADLITPCGLAAMIPGSHADALAAIDVPTMIGLAEHDIAGPPHEAPSHLTSCPDVTLYVQPGAYHNANVAPSRAALWDRVVGWAAQLRAPVTRLPVADL